MSSHNTSLPMLSHHCAARVEKEGQLHGSRHRLRPTRAKVGRLCDSVESGAGSTGAARETSSSFQEVVRARLDGKANMGNHHDLLKAV